MTAEVIYKGNGQFTLTLQTFSTTQTSTNGQEESAEWIVEGFGTKLADFGTIAFSGAQATINGLTGSISAWSQSHSYDMSSKSNTIQATTSGLTPGGSGFTVTWQHA
jgi:Peptidase A4 family